jgi:gas vesicle protein GvpL/GvpF
VTRLYVYAVLDAPASSRAGRGLGGGRVRIRRVGDLYVAVGTIGRDPAIGAATLRTHDAVVRRLATLAPAVLPVRFGTVVSGTEELRRLLAPRAGDLAAALALVEGREQMTLRVFGARQRTRPRGRRAPTRGAGPGARYLIERLGRARRARRVPEIAWLRPALRPFVTAERVERHDRASMIATVHHLIVRGDAPAYREAVAHASARRRGVRIVPSGPSPPYAFAPEAAAP